jgi:hypothetical protein
LALLLLSKELGSFQAMIIRHVRQHVFQWLMQVTTALRLTMEACTLLLLLFLLLPNFLS